MGEIEYSEALKLGKKEYRSRISRGEFPYLPVLDEILSQADIRTEQNMETCTCSARICCRNEYPWQNLFLCGKFHADLR